MHELILIGDNKELIRNLYDCLKQDFQVQMCSPQPSVLNGVSHLIRPDLIVICATGDLETDKGIFEWLHTKQMYVPALLLATSEQWQPIKEECAKDNVKVMMRPVTMSDIAEQCRLMTGGADPDAVSPPQKKKVMIVDDSPLVLRNTKAMLDSWYDVSVVPDAAKALGLMAKKKPDLILLDYEMPGMNGRQLHEAMKAEPELCDIPVIFLTNISDKKQVLEVLQTNPAGYILKPADRDQLLDMIDKVIRDV